MSNLNPTPLNLQQMLADYRCGKRELPTYDELVLIDIQMAVMSARCAALRHSLLTVIHEQKYIATCFVNGDWPNVA